MNDRYLYRAKRTDNGEWVEGYYAIARDIKGLTQHNILIADNNLGYFKWIVIDPSTICQCTGLRDKNGKLIFEKDIVKCECGIAIVVWDKSEWRIKWIKDTIWRRDLHFWVNEREFEVIGSVIDNPDLLECEKPGGKS